MKICRDCKHEKPLNEFYGDIHMKDGYKNSCKSCTYRKSYAWKKENVHKWRLQRRRNKYKLYGISEDEYNQKLKEQNNKCAICAVEVSQLKYRLCVDHSHNTGQARGLLCKHCNLVLGWARENTVILEQSIRYLNSHAK